MITFSNDQKRSNIMSDHFDLFQGSKITRPRPSPICPPLPAPCDTCVSQRPMPHGVPLVPGTDPDPGAFSGPENFKNFTNFRVLEIFKFSLNLKS